MRRGRRILRTVAAILLGIWGGRRGPDPARAEEPAPKGPTAVSPVPGRGTLVGVIRTASGPAAGARVVAYRHEARYDLVPDLRWRPERTAEDRSLNELFHRCLHPVSLAPTAEGRTDSSGRFQWTDLPVGLYDVVAWSSERGGVVGREWPLDVRSGAVTNAPLLLADRGVTLSGRLTRADGTPFTGFVFAVDSGGEELPMARYEGIPTCSDARGEFRFETLTRLPDFLFATDPGRAAEVVWAREGDGPYPADLRLDLVFGAGALPIDVGVVDAGTGRVVEGAVVVSWLASEAVSVSEGVTGADGHARFPGFARVRATAPGYLPADGRVDASAACTLRLERGATLRGTVRTPDGKAAANVPIHVERSFGWAAAPLRSGPSGEFELVGLPREPIAVIAIGDGWVPANALAVAGARNGRWSSEVNVTSGHGIVDLTVTRGSAMQIVVQSVEGCPICGVPVRLWPFGIAGGAQAEPGLTVGTLHELPTFTDEAGVARFDGLAPGFAYRMSVEAPGFLRKPDSEVIVREGVGAWTEVLERSRTVRVRVRERGSGAPVVGARLSVTVPRRADPILATTGVDGVAVIRDLPLDECTFTFDLHPRFATHGVRNRIPSLGPCSQELLIDVALEARVPAHR